jgi:hypothetical protein
MKILRKTNYFIFLLALTLSGGCVHDNSKDLKNNTTMSIERFSINTENNNFYDDVETHELDLGELFIDGEISNPGPADLSHLPLRTVIVKEAVLTEGGNEFVGAYRYDGYSLFDLLNNRTLNKKNVDEFAPIIDLYVEISNEEGESVVVSWGEIFYPVHLHEIIIATSVARIVPSKTKELWPLPEKSKLVIASDLLTERNISNPASITIKSSNLSFKTIKGLEPLYSPEIIISEGTAEVVVMGDFPVWLLQYEYEAVFYGRGRGIHSTTPFHGIALKDLLVEYFPVSRERLMRSLFVVAAEDGYRTVFTYSEVFNRNDQSEVLVIKLMEGEDGGLFRLYPSADFFSDRAVKAITEIREIKTEHETKN